VAHFVPSRGTWYSVHSCQELQVKNCKSRIAKKKYFRQFGHFFSRGLMNERIFSLVNLTLGIPLVSPGHLPTLRNVVVVF
jgi:hypothetical protein